MITQLTLGNVRLFAGQQWKFSLPSLCVFCGSNSSGKSTILKSLLLLRQSQGSQQMMASSPGRLRFVGPGADLGNYTTFISHNDPSLRLTIGVATSGEMSSNLGRHLVRLFGQAAPFSSRRIPFTFSANFTFMSRQESPEQGSTYRPHESLSGVLESSVCKIVSDDVTLLAWDVIRQDKAGPGSLYNTQYQINVPLNLIQGTGFVDSAEIEHDDAAQSVPMPVILSGLLPENMVAKIKKSLVGARSPDEDRWRPWPLPPHIDLSYRLLKRSLNDIHYLGPLRSPPKRYYITTPDDVAEMDPEGDFLPHVLVHADEIQVWHVGPSSPDPTRTLLIKALDSWLYYLRSGQRPALDFWGQELVPSVTKDVLFEFKIKTVAGNESHSLADSGFGYSQVLPIITRCLIAEKGSTVLIEQPELHLNPAMQVRLCEFFVAMVRAGKQVLIETHSEHIVNGLRVLVAEDESGTLASNSRIYFIDAQRETPSVHELTIADDGTVPDWPMSFFGEAINLSGRLLRAQKRFRNKPDGAH